MPKTNLPAKLDHEPTERRSKTETEKPWANRLRTRCMEQTCTKTTAMMYVLQENIMDLIRGGCWVGPSVPTCSPPARTHILPVEGRRRGSELGQTKPALKELLTQNDHEIQHKIRGNVSDLFKNKMWTKYMPVKS